MMSVGQTAEEENSESARAEGERERGKGLTGAATVRTETSFDAVAGRKSGEKSGVVEIGVLGVGDEEVAAGDVKSCVDCSAGREGAGQQRLENERVWEEVGRGKGKKRARTYRTTR